MSERTVAIPAAAAPADRLRILQVGAGGMGRTWIRALLASGDVELVGMVDLDLDLARSAVGDAGLTVPVATSLTKLLPTRPDAVLNVTVPAAHRPVSLDALAAGLPVLCEKPAAPTLAEAIDLAAASRASGRLVMISQSRRYYSGLATSKALVESQGPVGLLSCQFLKSVHFGGFREVIAQPLLIDMAIHHFDQARYLLDAEPVAVYCDTFNPLWSWYAGDAAVTAIFTFDTGARFTYQGSWCSPGLETSWNGTWRLSAERGTVMWDGDQPPVLDPPARSQPQPTPAAAEEMAEGIAEKMAEGIAEEVAGSLADFVTALRTGNPPQTEIHRNLPSLAMVEAAIQSATTGRQVLLADVFDAASTAAAALDPNEMRIPG